MPPRPWGPQVYLCLGRKAGTTQGPEPSPISPESQGSAPCARTRRGRRSSGRGRSVSRCGLGKDLCFREVHVVVCRCPSRSNTREGPIFQVACGADLAFQVCDPRSVSSLSGWRSATARDRRTDCLNRRHHQAMPAPPAFARRHSPPEQVYTCCHGHGENQNRAAQFYGDCLVRRLAIHHRVSPPDVLEGCPGDCVVAVLSWCAVRRASALIPIGYLTEKKDTRAGASRSRQKLRFSAGTKKH